MEAVFTRHLLFGMNLVTLVGFVLMGIALTLNRQQAIGRPSAFALMGVGTALLLLGFYIAPPATP